MWHSSTPIWNTQLLYGILYIGHTKLESVHYFACRVCTKRLNDAYTAHLDQFLKGNFLRLIMDLLTFQMHPQCTSLTQINFTRNCVLSCTLLQPQTSTNSSSFKFSHPFEIWNNLPHSVVPSYSRMSKKHFYNYILNYQPLLLNFYVSIVHYA